MAINYLVRPFLYPPERLVGHELAPSSRKLCTSLRLAAVAAVGAGIVGVCHVSIQLGTRIVWLLVAGTSD